MMMIDSGLLFWATLYIVIHVFNQKRLLPLVSITGYWGCTE